MSTRARATIKQRPAETSAAASAVAVLICWIAGVDDPGVLAALAVVIGFVPTLVTSIVEYTRRGHGDR